MTNRSDTRTHIEVRHDVVVKPIIESRILDNQVDEALKEYENQKEADDLDCCLSECHQCDEKEENNQEKFNDITWI